MKKARKGRVGIIIALAAALSCSSLVAVTKLCVEDGSGVITAMAETTSEVTEGATNDQIATVWNEAVQESIDSGEQIAVTLSENWTAATSGDVTSFGTGVGFDNGRINVPAGANIVLDLNGFTIDRALTVTNEYGGVINVSGTLEICDSSAEGSGLITGGYSGQMVGGGIHVDGGNLTLTGGAVTKNISCDAPITESGYGYGGGVCILNHGTFTMTGGKITENFASSGGGVYFEEGVFIMEGGEISDNTATYYGGGIAGCYSGDAPSYIKGGLISGNTATNAGGIEVSDEGKFVISGGEITSNTATNGGGVNVEVIATLTMTGGKIAFNSSTGGDTSVGGVSITSTSEFTMTGGEISNNSAVKSEGATCVAGVYSDGTINLSGGTILGNTFTDGEKSNLSASKINVTGKLPAGSHFGIYKIDDGVIGGYTASGNKLAKKSLYFSSDTADYEITDNGTDVLFSALSTPAQKDTVDWSYTSYDASFQPIEEVTVADGEIYATAVYTGGAFVFDAIASGLATAVNENGKTVTDFTNVGVYHLNVKYQNAANYENPIFTFEILPADLSTADVDIVADPVVYTGAEVTTSVKVFLGGTLLEEGKDYTVNYANNVNAGTDAGKVIITANGNYTGSVEGSFTINKAKLGVRWGITTLTYNGGAQELKVYPEGLADGDEVTLTVKYYDLDNNECSPVNVGKYIVMVTLEDDNYEFGMPYQDYLNIVEMQVDAIWSETEFDYDGTAKEITAYFVNSEGVNVNLTVTMQDDTNAGEYRATAALPAGDEYKNYVITNSTLSVPYVIRQTEVEAVWPEGYDFKYNGDEKQVEVTLTGVNGEDLSADLTYTYYDAEGNELTSLPVDAGDYVVKIAYANNNYKLIGKTEDTFTVAKADLVVTLDEDFDGVYDGNGKTPLLSVKDELGSDIAYKATYAPVDASGNVIGDYSEDLPVNVGKYVLKVEVDAANVAQSEHTETFEITPLEVTVEWHFDETAAVIDGVYTYLYNGKAHQPTATAQGVEELTLTVTGTGKSVGENYKSTASISDKNYNLIGDLEVKFRVIKSKVVSILWYEYGATEPVADDAKLSYEYISVFGQEEGARLSAYGVLDSNDESVVWSNSAQSLIALNVSYKKYSEEYWTELGTYTATASLSSADKANYACYMPLGINDEIEFEVTGITHSASVAQIEWIVIVNGKHVSAKDYDFVYNGLAQSPIAIRIKSSAYNPNLPDEETFEILAVGGAGTAAGTYHAYIIPEGILHEIKEEDSQCEFVISPKEIEIEWADATDGEVTVTYNGEEQSPVATVKNAADLEAEGLECVLTVDGFVDAGVYTAKAVVDGNFVITNSDSVKFTVKQLEISASEVKWDFVTGDEGEKRTDGDGTEYFVWKYDGASHFPTASLNVTLVEGGDPVEVSIVLTGEATTAGTHYAYATLDSADYANANFVMPVARLKLEIVQNTVTVIWEDAGEDGEIVYTYDGEEHSPKAYYLDGESKIYLNVIGSGTEAGQYVALITDSYDISNGKTKVFTVKEKQIKAKWDGTTVSYNGSVRTPSVTFFDVVLDAENNEVEIALRLNVDYTVTGYVNAGSYLSEITLLNRNYVIGDDSRTHELVIEKREVTLDWTGVDGSAEDFVWDYDGEMHAPEAELGVESIVITVKGAETNVGDYTAVATLNNDNYVITNPTQEFSIAGRVITLIWEADEEAEEGENGFTWEYKAGTDRLPKAYVKLDDGTKGFELTVVGAGTYAGEYTAKAILPADCEWAADENGECLFTITKKIVNEIAWEFDGATEKQDEDGNVYYEWTYDGKYHAPTAKITSTDEVLTVIGAAVNKGEYTAKAILANSDNYEFAEDVESTVKFVIAARTVNVTWKGEADSLSDFEWAYDGSVHCPTAWFTDVNGAEVEIPVIGGSASGGQHVAELRDVFDNYEFAEAKYKQPYGITENGVTVEWTGGVAAEDGALTFTLAYTGKAQMPALTVKDGEGAELEGFALNYVIKNADGSAAGAIINAGTYTVTVTPADKNYKITEGEATVTVIVEPKQVEVKWGDKELIYNGAEQAPKAWFEYADDNGNTVTVTLTVEGAGKEVGEYTAKVTSEFENFALTGDTQMKFNIIKGTATEYKWVWNADGTGGSWVEIKDESGEQGGEQGGETTDPVNPDPGTGESGEGGEGGGETTDPVTPTTPEGGESGGTGESGEPGGSLTDPETPSGVENTGDNEAIVPGSGESGSTEEGKEPDGDGNGDGSGDGTPEGGNA